MDIDTRAGFGTLVERLRQTIESLGALVDDYASRDVSETRDTERAALLKAAYELAAIEERLELAQDASPVEEED